MRFLSSIAFGSILAASATLLVMPALANEVDNYSDQAVDIGANTNTGPTDSLMLIIGTLDILDVFDTGGLAADSTLEVVAVFDAIGGDDMIIGKIDATQALLGDRLMIPHDTPSFDGGVLVELDPMTLGDNTLGITAPEVASLDTESVGDDTLGPVLALVDDVGVAPRGRPVDWRPVFT